MEEVGNWGWMDGWMDVGDGKGGSEAGMNERGERLARTLARCLFGTSSALALYSPPQVGKAETISAIEAPSVKHMQEPMNQHHTTCI